MVDMIISFTNRKSRFRKYGLLEPACHPTPGLFLCSALSGAPQWKCLGFLEVLKRSSGEQSEKCLSCPHHIFVISSILTVSFCLPNILTDFGSSVAFESVGGR